MAATFLANVACDNEEGGDWRHAVWFTFGVPLTTAFRMKLAHPALVKLLQKAYSGEKAAAFAYIGHARSLRDPAAKAAVRQIEADKWKHRENVLGLLRRFGSVPI